MITTIPHYTIESGHVRQSPRSEVGDDVLNALAPLLTPGWHVMPAIEGYSASTVIDGCTLAVTVCSESNPLGESFPIVTVYVCGDEVGLSAVLRATGAKPPQQLTAPCVIATLHATAAVDPDALRWMGDFERCLAWAWLERNKH